ncbi:hypothetical protein KBA63_02885 [Candidatus Woesebacteria bacterium]|nr:hypothetical protein [Candidatus Woesebacteria bacterium]
MNFENEPLKLSANLPGKTEERTHRVFWFKRENGEHFGTKEEEAWNLLCGRVKVFKEGRLAVNRCEYLGYSTSEDYFAGLKEMQKIFRTEGLEKAQDYLRQLEANEIAKADKSKRPRNFERTNTNGEPVDAEGTPIRF